MDIETYVVKFNFKLKDGSFMLFANANNWQYSTKPFTSE